LHQELLQESKRITDLESNLSVLRAKIKDDEKTHRQNAEHSAALAIKVSALTEELEILNSYQRDEAQLAQIQRGQAEKDLDTLQATVNSLTKSRQELADRLAELERDAAETVHLRQQLAEARRAESQLRTDLAALQVRSEQESERHDRERELLQEKHRAQLQEAQRQQQVLQQRLITTESAVPSKSSPFSSPSKATTNGNGAGHSEDAQEEIARLKEEIEDLKAELDDSQREVDSLSSVRTTY
jgi:DNA repair exonuclease SbcCD ATPase subunit